ncbi:MAG TPA: zinc-dependent metalloprotease [Solirubrobacteraceae bacterium]|nr:zinc-dependent metalloprotease [Solirubrobacteraceae bacterium]
MGMIDWNAAQRIGEMFAGDAPRGGVALAELEPRAQHFAALVATYSHMPEPQRLPPLEAVDRPAWIAANLTTMKPMLAPLESRAEGHSGPFAAQLAVASGAVMGAQVGALTGLLSQRVLGQYDLALLESDIRPRLLLLEPNLVQAARNLGLPRAELVLWVTIHEITHAVQFEGVAWLRSYLGGLVTSLLEGMAAGPRMPRMSRLPTLSELRAGVERAGASDLLRMTLGEERWEIVERIQSTMSLVEGHAEHVMDAVGAEVLPSMERLREALNRRRADRGLSWRVLERLLGLELKMRQYRLGRSFCDEIVRRGGTETLALAWRGADSVPTGRELEEPGLWMERVAA